MQLRRFTADSTPSALGAVRLALGDDAIILANRRLGEKVEIIATGQMDVLSSLSDSTLSEVANVVSETDTIHSFSDAATQVTPPPLVADTADSEKVTLRSLESASENDAESLTTKLAQDIDSISVDVPSLQQQKPRKLEPDTVQLSSAEQIANSTQAPEVIAANTVTISEEPSAEISTSKVTLNVSDAASLLAAIDKQSCLIDQRFRGLEVNLWGSCAPNRSLHLRRLFALGIGAELAIRLVERVDADMPVDDALRESFAMLKSTLPIGNDKSLSVPGVTVVSGPPGAGKTTALIKLATQHVKKEGNQSMVIICADTRRIGAFEELQAYGRLLGVPTVHAHDTTELESLIAAFTHKQLVLVDHTLPEGEGVIELPECLMKTQSDDRVRHLFVLPATSQSSTADALISRHCVGRSVQCVLTHLDTSARLGELFSSLIRHHLPVAYWSDSPSVQVPLQRAEASVLVATAVAMSRRLDVSPDDEWLQKLIQPASQLMADPLLSTGTPEVQNL